MVATETKTIYNFPYYLSAAGGLLLITVATESTDGFQRYLRSTQVNKLEGKVSGERERFSQFAFSSSLSHSTKEALHA